MVFSCYPVRRGRLRVGSRIFPFCKQFFCADIEQQHAEQPPEQGGVRPGGGKRGEERGHRAERHAEFDRAAVDEMVFQVRDERGRGAGEEIQQFFKSRFLSTTRNVLNSDRNVVFRLQ